MSPGTVLCIEHAFPPASGSGSIRAVAFARYLPEYGWRPIVLTTGMAWAHPRDDALLEDVPRDLAVVRTPSFESRAAPSNQQPMGRTGSRRRWRIPTRFKSQLAHAARFPDAQRGWTLPAVATGARTLRSSGASVLYSSAGPFTNNVVGLLLQARSGLPWVAELRDGWYLWNRAIFPDYPAWRAPLERRLEAAVIRRADRVVLVTEGAAEAFRDQYQGLDPSHFTVVPNGYDPEQLQLQTQCSGFRPRDRFQMVHAGALYHGRSLGPLLSAMGVLAQHDAEFGRMASLCLLGTLDAAARAELDDLAGALRIKVAIEYRGFRSHPETLEALRDASLLILAVNTTQGAEAAVPAKLFEYLAAGRPILALAPENALASDIVRRARAGWVSRAGDVDDTVRALSSAFAAFQQGDARSPDWQEVQKYDRRVLTGGLADVFEQAVATHGSRTAHRGR